MICCLLASNILVPCLNMNIKIITNLQSIRHATYSSQARTVTCLDKSLYISCPEFAVMLVFNLVPKIQLGRITSRCAQFYVQQTITCRNFYFLTHTIYLQKIRISVLVPERVVLYPRPGTISMMCRIPQLQS
jgi:hypothetical protein